MASLLRVGSLLKNLILKLVLVSRPKVYYVPARARQSYIFTVQQQSAGAWRPIKADSKVLDRPATLRVRRVPTPMLPRIPIQIQLHDIANLTEVIETLTISASLQQFQASVFSSLECPMVCRCSLRDGSCQDRRPPSPRLLVLAEHFLFNNWNHLCNSPFLPNPFIGIVHYGNRFTDGESIQKLALAWRLCNAVLFSQYESTAFQQSNYRFFSSRRMEK